jgi:hypothetical protein
MYVYIDIGYMLMIIDVEKIGDFKKKLYTHSWGRPSANNDDHPQGWLPATCARLSKAWWKKTWNTR